MAQVCRDSPLPDRLTNANLADDFFDLVSQDSRYWRIDPTVLKLKDVQGKIQLIRRFPLAGRTSQSHAGLDITKWNNYDNFDKFSLAATPTKNVIGQEHYQFVFGDGDTKIAISKKFAIANNLMNEAASNSQPAVWYINFASAYRSPPFAAISPWEFDQGLYDTDLDPL